MLAVGFVEAIQHSYALLCALALPACILVLPACTSLGLHVLPLNVTPLVCVVSFLNFSCPAL